MVMSGSQKNDRSKWLLAAALTAVGASKAFAQCGVPIPDGNIVLTVPAGGSVASSSGNLDCAQGQVCDYTVSGQAFNDTFTVTRGAGILLPWLEGG